MSPRLRAALLMGGVLGFGGCPTPEATTADDTAAPASSLPEICVDAPVSTYANFGRGFLTQHCNTCHAASSLDRHAAPPTVTFDTEEEAWAWADRILERAAGAEPSMPPQGGVSEDDRYLLEVWLTCGG